MIVDVFTSQSISVVKVNQDSGGGYVIELMMMMMMMLVTVVAVAVLARASEWSTSHYGLTDVSTSSLVGVVRESAWSDTTNSNGSDANPIAATTAASPHQQEQQQRPQMKNYSSYEELELLSANWQIVLVILYSLTAALALIGNVISIWVLTSGKRSSKELRIFLVNLSLSDITMALFSIPFTYTDFMLGRWIFAPAFCPIVQLMQMTSVFVSVYTLTAIGIDRYMAIMYPLLSNQYSRTFGLTTILIIWLCGITLGIVQWANTKATAFLIANEINYDCKEVWSPDESRVYTISLLIITFALPMSILSYAYGSVALKIFRHSTPGNADIVRDRAQHLSKIKIIKMLTTIVVLFAVCWLPLHVLNLFIYFGRDFLVNIYSSRIGFNIYVTIAIAAHWFSMANSFVNPIIYCFMSENFRADLRFLFRKSAKRCPLYRGTFQRRTTMRSTDTFQSTLCNSVTGHHHKTIRQPQTNSNHSSPSSEPTRTRNSLLRNVQLRLWIKKPVDPQLSEMCLVSVRDKTVAPSATAAAAAAAVAVTEAHPLASAQATTVSIEGCDGGGGGGNRDSSEEIQQQERRRRQNQGNGRIEHLCRSEQQSVSETKNSEEEEEDSHITTLRPLMQS